MNLRVLGSALLWVIAGVFAVVTILFITGHYRRHDPILIKSYEVPQAIAAEVQSTLSRALQGDGKQPLGRVALLPDGTLLVTAPVSVQAGVGHVMEQVARAKPRSTPTITFDAWVVKATPAGVAQTDAALQEIEPALAEVRKNKGALHFELIERLSTQTRAARNQRYVQGANGQMKIEASLRSDQTDKALIAAEVEIVMQVPDAGTKSYRSLKAEVEVAPGELLVLGQSAFSSAPRNANEANTQIYYIFRAKL